MLVASLHMLVGSRRAGRVLRRSVARALRPLRISASTIDTITLMRCAASGRTGAVSKAVVEVGE